MSKLEVGIGFTLGGLFLGVLVGAILGTIMIGGLAGSRMIGALNGAIIGALTGTLNGIVLAAVTARFFNPLQERKGYRGRMMLLALVFTAIAVLIVMAIASNQSGDNGTIRVGINGIFIALPAAPFIGWGLASWYLRTQR